MFCALDILDKIMEVKKINKVISYQIFRNSFF